MQENLQMKCARRKESLFLISTCLSEFLLSASVLGYHRANSDDCADDVDVHADFESLYADVFVLFSL